MPVFDIGLEQVSLSYATKNICDNVTVGVNEGDRIGIVGRNGDGKTTVLHLLSGSQQPDSGRVSARNGLSLGILEQYDNLDDNDTVQQAALGGQEEYEWASRQHTREIVETLLSGVGLDSRIGRLSGGQRRRVDLARLLLAVRGLLRSGPSCLLAGHLAVAGALRCHRLGGRLAVPGLAVALLCGGRTRIGLVLGGHVAGHQVGRLLGQGRVGEPPDRQSADNGKNEDQVGDAHRPLGVRDDPDVDRDIDDDADHDHDGHDEVVVARAQRLLLAGVVAVRDLGGVLGG